MSRSTYALAARSYYADFILVPLAAIVALVWLGFHSFTALIFFNAAVAGALAWSLAEYMIHRFVFHAIEPYKRQHQIHHIKPPAYIGVSPLMTLTLFAAFGFGLPWLLGPNLGIGFFVGLLAAYFIYIALHDHYHHGRLLPCGSLLWRLYQNHEWHHHRYGVNFGVSSPLWDHVFGTYSRPIIREHKS